MNPTQSAYDIAGGLGLPAEYFEFLATRNARICRQDRSVKLSDGTEVLCDCLFGINLQPTWISSSGRANLQMIFQKALWSA